MQCSVCQNVNPENAKFCLNCGNKLAVVCPTCGTENPSAARFCLNCGSALVSQPAPDAAPATSPIDALQRYMPPELLVRLQEARSGRRSEGERRTVTVLFADVAGSTAMAEQMDDPEEWTQIMNGAFDRLIRSVYRYEGTVARLMGDGMLAFFGAPIAHEDDPRRAVLAGIDMVAGIQEYRRKLPSDLAESFNVRVGINTGFVFVGEVGSDLRVEYTAMGDAVNVAARMEQTAPLGTVQIAQKTYCLVESLFDVEPLGEIEVKGKSQPVQSYRVLAVREGAAPRRGILGLHSDLVGRDAELAALQGSLEELKKGRGGIVSVMGEAGLGKTRLVAEARVEVPELRWLEGRSFPYETSVPYTQFASMLRGLIGLRGAQDDERYTRVREFVDAELKDDDGAAPYLAVLLGIHLPPIEEETVRHLDPHLLRGRVFAAVSTLLSSLAQRGPLALLFEDLHWADDTSLDLLESILPLTATLPILILAAFRPHHDEPSWRFHEVAEAKYAGQYRSLRLSPLTEEDSRTLVGNLLHIEDLPEHVRALILQKAEGNPFFVEEVIRSLLDAGLVVNQNGHWRATREIETITVPDTLALVITARLDRIATEPRRVAEAAAVIGREFASDVLFEVHDDPETVEPSLGDLQGRELIEPTVTPQRFEFKHILTQEIAYGEIVGSRRRELHRRAAETLERAAPERVAEIARHFMAAREEVRALPYLVAAGEQAQRAYATSTAIQYYRDAIRIAENRTEIDLIRRAYEGLGKGLELTNDPQGALDAYSRLAEIADALGDVPAKVSALNKRAFVGGFLLGQPAEAMADLDEAEALARQEQDARGLVETATFRCMAHIPTANFELAVDSLGSSSDVARSQGMQTELAIALAHSATTYGFMAKFDRMWELAQEGLEVAEGAGLLEEACDLLTWVFPLHYMVEGDLEAAERAALRGVRTAERIGDLYHVTQGGLFLGMVEQYRGDLEAAMRHLQRALGVAEMSGPRVAFYVPMMIGVLGCVSMFMGRDVYEQTMAPLQPKLDALEEYGGASTATDLGFCALELGDLDRAETLLVKATTQPSMTWLLERPRALAGLALVRLARGDIAGAGEKASEAREYAERLRMQFVLPIVGAAEGAIAVAAGDPKRAVEIFADAERLAISIGARPLVWMVQGAEAAALDALGRPEEAELKRVEARRSIDEMAELFDNESLRVAFLQNATRKVTVGQAGDPVR